MNDSRGDARTIFQRRSDLSQPKGSEPTKPMPNQSSNHDGDSEPTVVINPSNIDTDFPDAADQGAVGGGNMASNKEQGIGRTANGPKTVFGRHAGVKTLVDNEDTSVKPTTEEQTYVTNPVVGWLVIVKGYGQGNAFPFGSGQQKIGRNENQNIVLNFGDDRISGDEHAIIEYEPRSRKFYLKKGKNLVYLNEEDMRNESVLVNGDKFEIGETTLRFINFCGEDFDWNDQ